MAIAVLARPSFPTRLRLAFVQPFLLHLTAFALTLAAAWTYVSTTVLFRPGFQPMGDFDAYYRAANDLNHGLDPYLRYNHDIPFSLSLGYIYPPFLAHLLQPLALLPLPTIHVIVVIVMQLSVVASVLLTWKLLEVRSLPARLLVLDAFLLSSGLVGTLQVGNLNVVLVPLTLAFLFAYSRSSAWAYLFVGLNVGLKLTQAPLFALALFRKDFKGLSLGLLTLLSTILFGGLALAYEFFTTTFPRLSATVPTGAQNTSLLADFERLLHPGADNLSFDPTYQEAHFILLPIILLVLFFTARAIRGLKDRKLEALVALCAVPLLSNYLGAAHLLALLPLGLILASYALHLRSYWLFLLIALCVFLLADYALLYTLFTAFDYFLARALFYELLPGLAALTLWLIALRFAARTKAAYSLTRP